MFALTRLLNALATLADNLNALAGTVAEINGGLRHRLTLGDSSAETAVLAHQPPQDGTDGGQAADGPTHAPRGRRKGNGAA